MAIGLYLKNVWDSNIYWSLIPLLWRGASKVGWEILPKKKIRVNPFLCQIQKLEKKHFVKISEISFLFPKAETFPGILIKNI